ncbi:MAG TPA: dynamin family protein [Anaeromyxobacteraceae bacterium]|nr:dynamin family protein [Anaeromyxobacteraceae bacterium]
MTFRGSPTVQAIHPAAEGLLNPNHARVVVATFVDVDESLARVEALCTGRIAPFAPERADVDGEAGALLASLISSIRRRMLEALDRLGVKRPEPTISARWSIETALQFAGIAYSELEPLRLRGYGALSPEAEHELEQVVRSLSSLLDRGRALLHEADPAAMKDMLADIGGAEGEILRSLERMSADRQLVGVRPLIVAAAERVRSSTLDVGIFGRVSSGKSSLLNALLGETILPVGAVPVSAVPVWIGHGDEASARVRYLDGRLESVSLEQLASISTEQGNPDNALGIRSIEVTTPRLTTGLRFLDTPGVGSLSTSGPAQAFAHLPRCDHGLVLVPVGAPFGGEELALVRGLATAGVPAQLFLSKADLLGEAEQEEALTYLRTECSRLLGPGHVLETSAVSGRRPESVEVLRAMLAGMVTRHAAERARALQERILSLVRLTAQEMSGQLSTMGEDATREAAVQATLSRVRQWAAALSGLGPTALDSAVVAVAEAWRAKGDARLAGQSAITAIVSAGADRIGGEVEALRETLGSPRSSARLAPLFDPPVLVLSMDLTRPRMAAGVLLQSTAAHRLSSVREPLERAVSTYAARLRAWAEEAILDLGREASSANVASIDLPPDLSRLERLAEQICMGQPS